MKKNCVLHWTISLAVIGLEVFYAHAIECWSCNNPCECLNPNPVKCETHAHCYTIKSLLDYDKVEKMGCSSNCYDASPYTQSCTVCRGDFCNQVQGLEIMSNDISHNDECNDSNNGQNRQKSIQESLSTKRRSLKNRPESEQENVLGSVTFNQGGIHPERNDGFNPSAVEFERNNGYGIGSGVVGRTVGDNFGRGRGEFQMGNFEPNSGLIRNRDDSGGYAPSPIVGGSFYQRNQRNPQQQMQYGSVSYDKNDRNNYDMGSSVRRNEGNGLFGLSKLITSLLIIAHFFIGCSNIF